MKRNEELLAIFQKDRAACMPYFTLGYPDMGTSLDIIEACAENGADLIELGIPFSDPLADGPTIQASSAMALKNGATLEKILTLVGRVRERSEMPILLFGAYNPFFHYGHEALARRAVEVGVDGFLVPDVPIEESGEFEEVCRAAGLSMIYLVAPTTPEGRMREIAERGSGFLYYISLKGVTGVEIKIDEDLREQVQRLRRIASPLPVAVGFGIQTPEHARAVADVADAVVVGSALIRLIDQNKDAPDLLDQVAQYTRSLKAAL